MSELTPGRGSMGQDVSQSLLQRVKDGVLYAVTGVGPQNWFGPQQPLAPQAQDRAEGRAFDYPVGYNLRIQPREGEAVGFSTLRALADGYDLLRLVIETRKDQVESFDWEIVPRRKELSARDFADPIREVSDFLERPDKEHDWSQWLRMQVEDLLVIDALAVYPRATMGGDLYALELVDAATLKRVLDDGGRTPLAPSVAYQQVLKGIPAADYSVDDLVYTMRNPRTSRVYGFSPVEQVMMTVNIAMRRQLSQLDFYTAGNIPEAIAQVPEGWTPQQISDFQSWWDQVLEGNSQQRRKMRFVPNLKDIVFTKDKVLKDELDEWLARIVCFAFSITPSALVKQVNRASGEQMADTAKEEGLMPLLRFLEAHISRLIQRYMRQPDLRFQFKIVNKLDPESQAKVHQIYSTIKALTPDEVREDLHRDKLSPEEREAAFPTPPAPIMPGQEEAPQKDGQKPGSKVPVEEKPTEATKPAIQEETATEKMLAKALGMLDPSAIGVTMERMLAGRQIQQPVAPQIIELRPEINVEVGDTTVHVPRQQEPRPAAMPIDPRLGKMVVARRMADGSLTAEWVDKPADVRIEQTKET